MNQSVEINCDPAEMYLELLKGCLTRLLFSEYNYEPAKLLPGDVGKVLNPKLGKYLTKRGMQIVRRVKIDAEAREGGRDWPSDAETMVGLKRLDNISFCVKQILKDGIPGDFLETGVWRGGASIFMKAALVVYGGRDRTIWVADSFEGLPKPDVEKYPKDKGDMHWTFDNLRVSLEEVRGNFERYGLFDDNIKFLKGWFSDTMPSAPIEKLALLRADGDMYGSTMDVLEPMYPKLSKGGFLIIDDYALEGCRAAVHDYRKRHSIEENIVDIDGIGAFWRKS
ncbi:MAG: Mycinamicin III 3''-O-methyltransferase [bacterium ADurb.Bin236]|nr:MAG: Mycinamicin III 3''-O-methyltransferase [bacterium ADurb.Bin236]HOY64130.1 TylF/MycF/NovP-related O-methyltransferase [bacterium]HPN96043.1 TylF/MycF/NovP-related O-methyltransferase [bacterium]